MPAIRIIIADSNYLSRKGMSTLLNEHPGFELVAEASDNAELLNALNTRKAQLLVLDYSSATFNIDDIRRAVEIQPGLKILVITPMQPKVTLIKALDSGAISHLLKDCDMEEIIQAINETANGTKFLCGKILHALTDDPTETTPQAMVACDGVNITEREAEIIRLVAEGHSNKEIADLLFLSTHTVTTHRKNIMNKLGINNTAGLVLYAVRENIISPNKFLFSSSGN